MRRFVAPVKVESVAIENADRLVGFRFERNSDLEHLMAVVRALHADPKRPLSITVELGNAGDPLPTV